MHGARLAVSVGIIGVVTWLVLQMAENGPRNGSYWAVIEHIPLLSLIICFGIVSRTVYRWITRPQPVKTLQESYDYIVVGTGSSGAVLASRLSEDPSVSVLALEAGGSEEWSLTMEMPIAPIVLQKTDYDWSYVTESQKHACKAFNDQKSFWPRGRVLGGSSCLNYMVYVRGSRHDYDSWAANGCEGWSYKDVLPYFIKSENIQIPELKDSDYHGQDGPLHVSAGYVSPLVDIYEKAMAEIGYKSVDCNGEDMIGFTKTQLTTKHGARCSTVKAFLRPAMSRPNLHVSTHSVVSKVIIEDKKAVGVEIIKDGRKHVVRCNKEVILSAGAIGSPHILMLSGIGPKEHLQEHGINVHANLPVGENLQDHLTALMYFQPNQSNLGLNQNNLPTLTNMLKWIFLGKGYMSTSGLEGTAFARTNRNASNEQPDVQLHFFSICGAKKDEMTSTQFNNVSNETMEALGDAGLYGRDKFLILPILLHPKSRGTVKLKSSDPFDHPSIDPNYLSEKEDVDTFIRGIRLALEMTKTKTFKEYGMEDSQQFLKKVPFLSEQEFDTDAFWENYVRHLTYTIYHPTSTCKMGSVDDRTAVVDPQLRVRGIENLRVADASVMHTITSGNTNAPCIMIGEKAADLIQQKDSVKDIKQRIGHILEK